MKNKQKSEDFDDLIYEEVLKARQKFNESGSKPKMLLHVCCAICMGHVISLLNKEFDITVYYYNPNIHPKDEFDLRLSEVKRLIKEMNLDIKVICDEYNTNDFFDTCEKYKDEKEGGMRCDECFKIRMEHTAKYASENGFDLFATTLSISPHKDTNKINNAGYNASEKYGIHFAKADFKKKEGFKKTNEIASKYNVYRQTYCGCSYSLKESKEFIERREKINNVKD